jgi:hypothetical protein
MPAVDDAPELEQPVVFLDIRRVTVRHRKQAAIQVGPPTLD